MGNFCVGYNNNYCTLSMLYTYINFFNDSIYLLYCIGTMYDVEISNGVSTLVYHNVSDVYPVVPQHFKILLYCVLPASVGLIITIIIDTFALVLCNRSKSGGTNRHENSEESPHYETINPEIHATKICYELAGIDMTFNKHINHEEIPHYETMNPEIHTTNVCYEVARINVAFNAAYTLSTKLNSFLQHQQKPNITSANSQETFVRS